VVGAHYDAVEASPGADDNASGVAGLIELAYLLGDTQLSRGIELVAYTLEEPPFFGTQQMGSAYHVESLADEGVEVTFMIALEMIGYFSNQPGSQQYPWPFLRWLYPNQGNFIALIGRWEQRHFVKRLKGYMKGSTDLPVYSMVAPSRMGSVDFSDHRNYWNSHYDALMVTDTAFYRNTKYHSVYDTADRLDYSRMGKVVIGVYEMLCGFMDEENKQ
jgi:Zn-dependent M28 family amino/carboxypeptidase